MEHEAFTQQERKIVLFGDFQESGGVERCFANMIPIWNDLGYHVEIVGYRTAVPFYPDELNQVNFIHLGTRGRLPTALSLWRYLRRTRPHAVIATGHISNTILARVNRLPGIEGIHCLLNVQNDFVASRKDRIGRKRARKLREIHRLYPAADGLVTTSRGIADNLSRHAGLGNLPVHVIHSGVITRSTLERAEEEVNHPWLDSQRTTPVILGIGRLAPQKDFPTLIHAFSRVRSSLDARLVILGEGPERGDLEELVRELEIAEHVTMPGFVENPYAWMRRADVFVLSSAWEGFGNVVAEALGLGVPVVTTDCASGPAEIVGHGRYGRVTPVADVDALAEATIQTLEEGRLPYDPAEARQPFTDTYAAHRYLEAFGFSEPTAQQTSSSA